MEENVNIGERSGEKGLTGPGMAGEEKRGAKEREEWRKGGRMGVHRKGRSRGKGSGREREWAGGKEGQ